MKVYFISKQMYPFLLNDIQLFKKNYHIILSIIIIIFSRLCSFTIGRFQIFCFCFFVLDRERASRGEGRDGEGQRETESQADCILSAESNTGPDPTSLGSRSASKSRPSTQMTGPPRHPCRFQIFKSTLADLL